MCRPKPCRKTTLRLIRSGSACWRACSLLICFITLAGFLKQTRLTSRSSKQTTSNCRSCRASCDSPMQFSVFSPNFHRFRPLHVVSILHSVASLLYVHGLVIELWFKSSIPSKKLETKKRCRLLPRLRFSCFRRARTDILVGTSAMFSIRIVARLAQSIACCHDPICTFNRIRD